MTPFTYLARDHGVLTASYGVTKEAEIARAVAAATTPAEIIALETRLGRRAFDAGNAERLRAFVTRYVSRRNAYRERPASLASIAPPGQFISHRPGVDDTGGDRITEVAVWEVTTWYDGRVPRQIRSEEVARITLAAEP